MNPQSLSLSSRKGGRRKVTINVTSLIDVLFLLLIFFMVSSTFAEQPRIKLELPEATTSEVSRIEPWILSLTQDEQIFLNDDLVNQENLLTLLRAQAEEDPEKVLVLKADQSVSYGFLIRILDQAKQSGIKHISALTKPIQQE